MVSAWLKRQGGKRGSKPFFVSEVSIMTEALNVLHTE
jgi:hypothetical protein